VTALRRVLEMIAAGRVRVDGETVAGLGLALDVALTAYAAGEGNVTANAKSEVPHEQG
jgi:hypothetical protein